MALTQKDQSDVFDVAVIGCGPVGAFAANLLGQAGLSTLVLEASAAPHPLPRAVHIDHEMMRLFQSIGLAQKLSKMMREAQGHIHIGADGGVIRYMGTAGKPRRFGWANDYFFYQPEFEACLREGFSQYPNVSFHSSVLVTCLTSHGEVERITVSGAEGERDYRARYVIACDGAKSPTRKSIGVALDDLNFEEAWLVVDANVSGPIQFPTFEGVPEGADLQHLSVMVCDPRRPMTIVPGRGRHRRWEFMLLPGEVEADMVRKDVVTGLIAPWIGAAPHEIIRATTYRFHGLVAQRWRSGRVFLAGDAAHQTPPFFGQGMCHGLRDVSNLIWKLDLVTKGVADESILESYEAERAPQVRAVIGLALSAGRYICELDPEAAALRDAQLRTSLRVGLTEEAPAPDIIPPYSAGLISAGAGWRFIQPRVQGADGEIRLLDDVTGGGVLVLYRAPLAGPPAIDGSALANVNLAWRRIADQPDTNSVVDIDGDLGAWLDARNAHAVIVRPDAYVFGVAKHEAQLADLLNELRRDLQLKDAQDQDVEAAKCIA